MTKFDRKQLALLRPIPFIRSPMRDRPQTAAEYALANIWSEILGCDNSQLPVTEIQRGDDFFCLGGSSVHVTSLLDKIKQKKAVFPYAESLNVTTLFRYSNLKGMAKRASGRSCIDLIRMATLVTRQFF